MRKEKKKEMVVMDKKLYVVIGFLVAALTCFLLSSSMKNQGNKSKQKNEAIKTRWRAWNPSRALVAENLVSETLRVNEVFFDHEQRWEPQEKWTAVNSVFLEDKEVWKPDPRRSHIEYTLIYFDDEKGGRVVYRANNKTRTRSKEFIMAPGDVICMTSGPENEMKIEGTPLLFYFRAKPFPPSSKFQAILDRSKALKMKW